MAAAAAAPAGGGFGFDPAVFQMTHSPIMAPFLVNCVCEMLNRVYSKVAYDPVVLVKESELEVPQRELAIAHIARAIHDYFLFNR